MSNTRSQNPLVLRLGISQYQTTDALRREQKEAEALGFRYIASLDQTHPEEENATVLVVNTHLQVTEEKLSLWKDCEFIITCNSGYDNVDLKACWKRKHLAVCNLPQIRKEAVAWHTLGLMVSLTRNLFPYSKELKEGTWNRKVISHTLLLPQLEVGIVGFGNIGKSITEKLIRLGVTISVYDPYVDPLVVEEASATPLGIEAVMERADILSLHCPLTDETKNLVDAKALKRMKQGALLVNTARGALIDPKALLDALKTNHLSGAGIDVYSEEPPFSNPTWQEILKFDSVITTPHAAGHSQDLVERVVTETIDALERFRHKRAQISLLVPARLPWLRV